MHGNHWVGNYQGLFYQNHIDFTNLHFKQEEGNPNSLKATAINDLFEDNAQNIWVTTSRGLNI